MARYLRANTATIVTVGPFYDKTDGVTIENSLTITNERITLTVDNNDGSAPTIVLNNVTGATSATDNDLNYIAGCAAGLMQLELSAANTNHAGKRAMLTITDAANHVPVFHEFQILVANVYDALIGTDYLDVSTVQLSGTACTGRDIGASVLLSSGTGTGQVSLSSGTVTVGTNNDKTGYTASTVSDKTGYSLTATTGLGNQTANITGNLSGSVGSVTGAVGSVTGAVGSVTGAVGSVTGNVGGNVVGSVGSVVGHTAQTGDCYAIVNHVTYGNSAIKTLIDAVDDYVDTEVGALTTELAKVPKSDSTVSWNATALAAIQQQVDDALTSDTGPLSLAWGTMIERIYQMISNRMTVNESTGAVALRNIGNSSDIATGNVASSSGTTTRAELSWV